MSTYKKKYNDGFRVLPKYNIATTYTALALHYVF